MTALEHIMDAIDIETYLICKDENEGRMLALQLGKEMNIGDVDIMFMEFDGYGMRVRLRKYIYKPGDNYKYLNQD
jgi:hypothetical protein